ncbi:MAG TPA: cupredoxin domain-containing protein [Acidimicrobiales bacterium]|nr:cupredoxin domain-containing protein [Acidimicrobiales bacterium]
MKLSRPLPSVLVAVALVAVACGGSGENSTTGATDTARTVEVTMVDNRFEPATLGVQRGDEVKFVFRNSGTVVHDAFVGDASAQAEHEAGMNGGGGGHDAHGGDDSGAITVEPGQTGTLTHTFDEAGRLEIGCHEPGHYPSGMKIDVVVS